MNTAIIIDSGEICDQGRMADPETIIQLVHWLEQERDFTCVVAFYFRADILTGYVIERAEIGESTMLESRNLFRAALRFQAESITIICSPIKNYTPDELQQLINREQELSQAGIILGIEFRDIIITGRVGSTRKEYVSLRHTQSTPFAEEK